jgi:uroporphyrin-3 C-methyltransferase
MSDKNERDAELETVETETDQAEGDIIDVEVTEIKPEPEPEAETAESKPANAPRIALVIAIIALVGVLGLLAYGYQHLESLKQELTRINSDIAAAQQSQEGMNTSLQDTQQAFEQQKQRIEQQQATLQDQDSKLEQERERLQAQGEEMKQTLEKVYQRVGRNSTDWMAAEAEYLLGVANHRLRLEADVATAVKALQAADARLRESGDPGWIDVRNEIASEITTLKGIGQVDRAGLAARLSGMAAEVQKLKVLGSEPLIAKVEPKPELSEPEERNFKTLLKDSWEGFKSVMVVRHHGKPVAAMLPPEQQFFIYQNTRLQFETARMAMLRSDQALYSAGLETAEKWLQDFFDTEQGATKALLQQISELKAINVKPGLPDISGSLMALRRRLKSMESGGGAQ